MLSDAQLQLLTAFVDGELSRRQRKAVLRLLHRSSEARSLLGELQENAHFLKQLPQHRLPEDFPNSVLQAIERSGLRPAGLFVRSAAKPWRFGWVAAAACLLIAVGTWAAVEWSGRVRPFSTQMAQDLSREIAGGSVAAQPLMVALHELGDARRRQELERHVRRNGAVHLDMPVADAQRAVQELGSALKAGGIRVLGEVQARKALQRDGGKGQVLVYAENLQPEELLEVLDHLSKKAPRTGSAFGTVTVSALQGTNHQVLSRMLGVQEEELSEADSGKNDGSAKKSRGTTPPAPGADRLAVVLAADTSGRPGAEVRSFLNQRSRLRPGAVRVLVVLHTA